MIHGTTNIQAAISRTPTSPFKDHNSQSAVPTTGDAARRFSDRMRHEDSIDSVAGAATDLNSSIVEIDANRKQLADAATAYIAGESKVNPFRSLDAGTLRQVVMNLNGAFTEDERRAAFAAMDQGLRPGGQSGSAAAAYSRIGALNGAGPGTLFEQIARSRAGQ